MLNNTPGGKYAHYVSDGWNPQIGDRVAVMVGDEWIGSYVNEGEFGVEVFNDAYGRSSLGMVADEAAAETTLFDRWWEKRQSNGGSSTADEERLEPQSTPPAFLSMLRPGGPWVPTAIVPDGPTKPRTITTTAYTAGQVEAFVREHNGKRNLYYSVNPTRTAMSKKTAKTDIAAIEYVLGDLDPADGETSEAAKARYLEQLNGAFEPRPTAAVDSGNGIQGLWRLKQPIILGELVNGKFSPEDQAKIDDVEARSACLMKRLGAKAGTQNIDRILRLPGTTNLPNAKKRKDGRVECQTALLWFNGVEYPLEAFPKGEGRGTPKIAKPAVEADDDGDRDETGSGYGFRFMQDCHDRKMGYQEACAAIRADNTKAGEWANRVDERQLATASRL